MIQPHNKERVVAIHKMLFEMARGNFSGRIPLSSHDDALETLVVLINMVAEEMKESIFHIGYVNPHRGLKFTSHMSIILDPFNTIISFTPDILSFLGYLETDLIEQPIQTILTKSSHEELCKARDTFQDDKTIQRVFLIQFNTKDQLLISVQCTLSPLLNRSDMVLSFVTTFRQEISEDMEYAETDPHPKKQPGTRQTDAQLIQKLYDYILAHLDEPLPSIKKLALQFGTNEFKIKDGFRYFFKTSIYKFYTEERLKRAHLMIQQTSIPLKNIASMNGYHDYPNFSKAFKKHFGHPPYTLSRPKQ
jgi:AraC-like DNA-binding protein